MMILATRMNVSQKSYCNVICGDKGNYKSNDIGYGYDGDAAAADDDIHHINNFNGINDRINN